MINYQLLSNHLIPLILIIQQLDAKLFKPCKDMQF